MMKSLNVGQTAKLIIKQFGWIAIALSVIGGVAMFNRFPEGMVFAGGDVVQYFNQNFVERNFHHIWSNVIGEGGFSPVFLYYPIYWAIFTVSDLFGVNPSQQSVLYMFFFWGGAYIGCLFGLSLLTNRKFSIWSFEASLFALIYALNPYTFYAFYFIWGYSPFLYLYLAIPVLVITTIEFICEADPQRGKRLLMVLFFAHLFATIAYANLSFFVGVNLVLAGLGLAIWILASKATVKEFLIKIIAFLAIELAATGWATLPQLPNLLFENNPIDNGGFFDYASWILWQRLSFREIFSLNPAAGAYGNDHPFAMALGLIIIGLAVWLGCQQRAVLAEHRRWLAVLLSVLIVALLETKGKGIVPDAWSVWAFSNPVLGALRSFGKVFIFLPFLVILMLLLGISSWSNRARKLLAMGVFIVCVLSAYPMFLGGLQTEYSVGLKSGELCSNAKYCYLNRIPPEYSEAADVIKHDGLDGKILSLPYSVINSPGWSNYPTWKHVGSDPTVQLFSLPVVQMNAYHVFGRAYGLEWAQGGIAEPEFFKLVADLGISYLLFHKDVRQDFIGPAARILQAYEQKGLIRTLYESRTVSIYRVGEDYLRQIVTADSSSNPKQPLAAVNVVKVDPTKYIVSLPVSAHENNVVLREAFSRQWKVHILPYKRSEPVEQVAKNLSWWDLFFFPTLTEDSHTRFGGYGNVWKINTDAALRDFGSATDAKGQQTVVLVLEYLPQRYINILLIVAVLGGLAVAALTLRNSFHKLIIKKPTQ